jgi:autotransporter strand-loop-strand O-heptosyltransferase
MKILFLAPHLSTGGMPAFLLKRIECLSGIDITVVEYANYSDEYVVQKNRIKSLVSNFYTLQGDKAAQLVKLLEGIDIVHVDEMIERLSDVAHVVYSEDRTWRIVETCHDVSFDPKSKFYHPDAYAFCTPYHLKTFTNVSSYKKVMEFPIDDKVDSFYDQMEARKILGFANNKKHVVNIGLWTPGKNQGEGLEIARKYPHMMFHFVGNQAANFQQYWKPLMKDLPENVRIWGERNDTDRFLKAADIFMFNSTWECNPLVLREAISHQLPIVARNLPQYEDMFTPYLHPIDTDLDTIVCNYNIPTNNTSLKFGIDHDVLYRHVLTLPITKQEMKSNITISQNFIENPFLEIKGSSINKFRVRFYDDKGVLHYSSEIGANSWVKLNRQYFTKWITRVWENNKLIYENVLNLKGKRVYIAFDSSSLGDNIAWVAYCLEFKKKHNCHVIVSTFKNFLFKDVYPELEFVNPGDIVLDVYAMYKIGWFYDSNKEPALPNTVNLQKCAANILGLDYQEIRPRISYQIGNNLYGRYVTIATNSTAGCKFWTKEGWQGVINYLVEQGYSVVNVSKERNPFDNCIQIEDDSMENTMNVIHHSEFFIGLSSGLSWLAWAMGKKVVMISNFTQPNHEFSCIRITKKNVCNGCWNNPKFRFDKGDWNWCPIHKGTDRQFECHTAITAQDVIDAIK